MIVKGREIGTGMPCICVPVVETTKEAIIKEIIYLSNSCADMIEWRIDCYEDVNNFNEMRAIFEAVSPYIKNKIFLYTFRTKAQGGNATATNEELSDLWDLAAESKCVDFIDMEYFEQEKPTRKIHELQKKGIRVVASHHDFCETPEREVIKILLEKMCAGGADIVKLAAMPQTQEDVLQLLSVTSQFKKENPDTPVITMSMGELGMISRICGETFGSCVTFATHLSASAPGQMGMEEVSAILQTLHQNTESAS